MGPRFNPPGDSSCPTNGYFWQVNPIIRHMGWGEPAVGPNGVVHYVFAGAGTKNGDKGDIFYTRSTDNGKTWSTPIKLNTDTDSTSTSSGCLRSPLPRGARSRPPGMIVEKPPVRVST